MLGRHDSVAFSQWMADSVCQDAARFSLSRYLMWISPKQLLLYSPSMAENAAAFATPKVLEQDETMRQCDRFLVGWLRKADVENIIV